MPTIRQPARQEERAMNVSLSRETVEALIEAADESRRSTLAGSALWRTWDWARTCLRVDLARASLPEAGVPEQEQPEAPDVPPTKSLWYWYCFGKVRAVRVEGHHTNDDGTWVDWRAMDGSDITGATLATTFCASGQQIRANWYPHNWRPREPAPPEAEERWCTPDEHATHLESLCQMWRESTAPPLDLICELSDCARHIRALATRAEKAEQRLAAWAQNSYVWQASAENADRERVAEHGALREQAGELLERAEKAEQRVAELEAETREADESDLWARAYDEIDTLLTRAEDAEARIAELEAEAKEAADGD